MEPGSDDPVAVAVAQLEQFGPSTDAARTFVAPVRLDTGTVRDVSRVAEVPRTRVDGAIEAVEERGRIDAHQSSPGTFSWASCARWSPGDATTAERRDL
jgi:sugar-specific transcriptional regulator TrmB